MSERNERVEIASTALLASMTTEERYYAWHFLAACEEGVGFCVPREMRHRLRNLGLMRWVGGPWFETTEKLADIEPALSAMYPKFNQDANAELTGSKQPEKEQA